MAKIEIITGMEAAAYVLVLGDCFSAKEAGLEPKLGYYPTKDVHGNEVWVAFDASDDSAILEEYETMEEAIKFVNYEI